MKVKYKYCLTALLMSACSLTASGQHQFDNCFKSPPRITHGMFDTYESDGNMYWAIPDSLLDREYSITTTILQAPESPNRKSETKYGYAGDLIGPMYMALHKRDGKLIIADPLHSLIITDRAGDVGRIAKLTPTERTYRSLPVVAESNGMTLVEIGTTLKCFTLFALEPAYYDMKISARDAKKDTIEDVKGRNDCILLRISRTYCNMTALRPTPGKTIPSYEGIWKTGVCISLMPKTPIPMKRGDGKTYFEISKRIMADSGRVTRMPIIKRWRLDIRPEDRERYFKGELVEPVNPIVFYVDRNFPKLYQKSIIEAVREWRQAFEQAGFKNAIDARLAPTPKEDPDFCMYDSRYPYISWKTSGMANAYGPSPCEGRSGEITACHVGVFSSVLQVVQNWYFAQCGAVDPVARKPILPEWLQCELLKLVITHEIGHSLGLEHNYSGSSHASIDNLRDNEYLSRHGIGSSIMDYVRFNYALRPGDKVKLANRRIQIGAYDRWAIEWGYRIFPGDTSEEQEQIRRKWYEQQKKDNPELAFYDMRDVRSQQEDLGNDHVAVNTQGIENLKYLCSLKDIWKTKSVVEEQIMRERYKAMIEHYGHWVGHVTAHLGGCRYVDGKLQLESAEYCRKAVRFLQDYVFTPPTWLFDRQIIDAVHADRQESIDKLYISCMDSMRYALELMAKQPADAKDVMTKDEFVESIESTLSALDTTGDDAELNKYVQDKWNKLIGNGTKDKTKE